MSNIIIYICSSLAFQLRKYFKNAFRVSGCSSLVGYFLLCAAFPQHIRITPTRGTAQMIKKAITLPQEKPIIHGNCTCGTADSPGVLPVVDVGWIVELTLPDMAIWLVERPCTVDGRMGGLTRQRLSWAPDVPGRYAKVGYFDLYVCREVLWGTRYRFIAYGLAHQTLSTKMLPSRVSELFFRPLRLSSHNTSSSLLLSNSRQASFHSLPVMLFRW